MHFEKKWPAVCDALGSCARRERAGHFLAHGLELYVGPNREGAVVLVVKESGLNFTPRMFELVKQYVRQHFPSATAFQRQCSLPSEEYEADFVIQLDRKSNDISTVEYTQLYHRLWSLLAALGDFPGQSAERLARRVIPHLTPKFGGDHKRARGKVALEFAPTLDGEILLLNHGSRQHSLYANFRLPIGSKTVQFRSRTLPTPSWTTLKVDDALCDDFFHFDATSNPALLHSWVPLVHVLAMHDLDFKVESDEGRTLIITAERVHAWTCGPLLQVIGEMWGALAANAMNIGQQVRAPAPFSSLKYRVPE